MPLSVPPPVPTSLNPANVENPNPCLLQIKAKEFENNTQPDQLLKSIGLLSKNSIVKSLSKWKTIPPTLVIRFSAAHTVPCCLSVCSVQTCFKAESDLLS